ncbi:MAG: tetratricopeptide repeat protein [Candidatus Acidiferrum sp.]
MKVARAFAAAALAGALLMGTSLDLSAGTRSHKKKKSHKSKAVPCRAGCVPNSAGPPITAETPSEQARERELRDLARALHTATPGAYQRLASFSSRNAANIWGARAALALGYDDYAKNHAQQSLGWLAKAKGDTLLRQYVLYWSAQAEHALKRAGPAYADLLTIQRECPDFAMKEQFLELFAPTAVETGHPQEAIDALTSYAPTAAKPALLLERAQAYQAAHQLTRAAGDYQAIFYKYPLSDESKAAEKSLAQVSRALGSEYAYPGAEMQLKRAQIVFDAHKWKEARSEFEKLLAMLHDPANSTRQRAELRVAEANLSLKGSPGLLASLNTPDAEVDAERLYLLSQAYRAEKNETEMLAGVEALRQKYPHSTWTEEALFAAGNYYWVLLDRTRAVAYYQHLLDDFPEGKDAYNAEWRIAWMAFLNQQPDADQRLSTFLIKFPVSANAVDALYWLGRSAERGGNRAHARSYYAKAIDRFPQTYFAHAAESRLAKLGPGEADPPEFLARIPEPPMLRGFDDPIAPAAADRWSRAHALRSIGFDGSAELELKNAYFATSSPRFLLEAAQAAFDQGHFAAGMAYGRLIVPSFDSRKFSDVPVSVWKILYPLPYESALRREAAKYDFDPMFAAGLIRQESTFQADIVSYANAIGLMQVLPKTGKILAKQLRVHYNKNLLFQPDYNLQLGMLYIANLVRLTGAPEYAAAAYNAGEDRIAAWKAERNYEEIPELVEAIPFTQTREYVQIVLRNAAMYRMIYGPSGAPTAITSATANRRTMLAGFRVR